jgi:hypothetical protein
MSVRLSAALVGIALFLVGFCFPAAAQRPAEPAPAPPVPLAEPEPQPSEGETEPSPAPRPEDPAAAAATRAAAEDDPSFGPLVSIERIDVVGRLFTAERLVRRALLFAEGDRLRSGDPRFRRSRFRVLALGYFVDVKLSLGKGRLPGQVVVTVEVWERGTFLLDSVFLGASEWSPTWVGADAGDANFLGTGLTVSAAVVYAAAADPEDARDQWAARLRYGDPSVLGSPLALRAQALYNRASEPGFFSGPGAGTLNYTRAGGSLGMSWDATRRLTLLADLRGERVQGEGVDATFLASAAVGAEVDTRVDPVLPEAGNLFRLAVEAAPPGLDFEFAVVRGRVRHWFSLRGGHTFMVGAGGALLLGDPPSFDWLYASDLDRLLPRRPLGLGVSARAPFDLLGQNQGDPYVGRWGGLVEGEYRYRWFRRKRHIYGGDLFVGAGVYTLGGEIGGVPERRALDLTFDVGVRLDTEVGIFELSLANALGRVPL